MQSLLLPLLLVLLGAVVGLAAIVVILRLRRPRLDAPTCAACGYDLTARLGVATVCPECGRRLDDEGAVIAAGRRPPLSMGRRVLLLTLVLLGLGLAVTPLADHLLPRLAVFTQSSTLTAPQSGKFKQVTVASSVTSMRRPLPVAPATTVTIVDLAGTTFTLTVDRPRSVARFADAAGLTHQRPVGEQDNATGDAIMAWMTAIGLDAEASVALRREADALAAHLHAPSNYVRALPGDGWVSKTIADTWPGMPFNNTRTTSAMVVPQPARLPLLASPWVALWLLGLLVLYARRAATSRRPTPA